MQATVRSFDRESRSGTVLLDDGIELPYDAPALADSGLRLLRVGQRVRIELEPSGLRIAAVTLAPATWRRP